MRRHSVFSRRFVIIYTIFARFPKFSACGGQNTLKIRISYKKSYILHFCPTVRYTNRICKIYLKKHWCVIILEIDVCLNESPPYHPIHVMCWLFTFRTVILRNSMMVATQSVFYNAYKNVFLVKAFCWYLWIFGFLYNGNLPNSVMKNENFLQKYFFSFS